MSFKFELGIEAKSDISGFIGIITSRSEHLNGCNRYWLAPKVDKDGNLPKGYWMDEPELKLTKKASRSRNENGRPGGFPSQIK